MTVAAPNSEIAAAPRPRGGPGFAQLWPAVQSRLVAVLTMLVAATVIYLFAVSLPNLGGGSPVFPETPWLNRAILVVHVMFALPPLILGLYAFQPGLRRKRLGFHRWIGRVYCICIWVAALSGILLAGANRAGAGAISGFAILGILWYWTTLRAYSTARARDIRSHREWMIRSYGLTLAVVTVRPMFLVEPPASFDPNLWLSLISWACWVPNLILAEMYLRVTTPTGAWALGRAKQRAALSVSSP